MDVWAFQLALVVNNQPASVGDVRDNGSIPGQGRYHGGGHGNPLQYSCLENPTEGGAWQVTVHRVTELNMTGATPHMHTYGQFITVYIKIIKKLKQLEYLRTGNALYVS